MATPRWLVEYRGWAADHPWGVAAQLGIAGFLAQLLILVVMADKALSARNLLVAAAVAFATWVVFGPLGLAGHVVGSRQRREARRARNAQ